MRITMMIRSSMGGPSFSFSLLAFNRGREDGNPFSAAEWAQRVRRPMAAELLASGMLLLPVRPLAQPASFPVIVSPLEVAAGAGDWIERPLSRLPGPTNVARYVRDRDQQRWRRCVGSNPLAPTKHVA